MASCETLLCLVPFLKNFISSAQDRQLEEHFPSAWPGVLHLSRYQERVPDNQARSSFLPCFENFSLDSNSFLFPSGSLLVDSAWPFPCE
ncbi:UNVERIFIED_CONTAM: hypothetical protein Sangu_1183000 [Sesamum angustifolium]|uniref:Uncharacterized protein n=1 Tax=Sesamum angustifolium TaxID=2727405 RepID=A0AAW2NK54_9LAMI